MANMLDTLNEYGSVTFDELPFGAVDNLAFAQLSYSHFEDAGGSAPMPLRLAAERIRGGGIALDRALLDAAARGARYSGCMACRFESRFDEERMMQFAAVTFLLTDGTAYVSFRGTDSTLVGWEEDFNLAFESPVPAQREAVRYLNETADILACPLRVGGHSKGGNLAVYAAAFCRADVQRRILAVYNNDGPGHDLKTVRSEPYRRVEGRIQTYIPKSSIIGMLLEHGESYRVVDSDARGLFQHNPYTWQTRGADFAYLARTTAVSDTLNESIREWLAGMDTEKRRFLTRTIFDVLGAGSAQTLRELRGDTRSLGPVLAAAIALPPEDRRQFFELVAQFLKTAAQQYGNLMRDAVTPLREALDELRDEARPGLDRLTSLRALAENAVERIGEIVSGRNPGGRPKT